MTAWFCPACWAEVERATESCPRCGSDLGALDASFYEEKLRRALWHPEGFTARRAAWLLGRRRDAGAVGALAERATEQGCGLHLTVAIAEALAAIGTREARAALRRLHEREERPLVRRRLGGLLRHAIPS